MLGASSIRMKNSFLFEGRRFKDLSPGAYRSTLSSQQPVIIEGHWQDITVEEQVKNETLQKLQVCVYSSVYVCVCVHAPSCTYQLKPSCLTHITTHMHISVNR